jgi:hypothetical protein
LSATTCRRRSRMPGKERRRRRNRNNAIYPFERQKPAEEFNASRGLFIYGGQQMRAL